MTAAAKERDRTEEALLAQYVQLLDTYRHHFELVMRAITIYVAIIGTATGFIFRGGAGRAQGIALACFVAITSAIPALGHVAGLAWVSELERPIRQIESQLNLPVFPLTGIRIIIRMCGLFNILVVIAGVVIAYDLSVR